MKKFTLSDSQLWWHDKNFSCIHQLTAIEFFYMLKDSEGSGGRIPDLIEFLHHLNQVSCGIPHYLTMHPKYLLFRTIEQVASWNPQSSYTEKLPYTYDKIEQSMRLLQEEIRENNIEFFTQEVWNSKVFHCSHEVTSKDLYEIFDDWDSGLANEDDVFGFVEGIHFISGGFPEYPEDDPRSVITEVLNLLYMGYTYPILKEDISAFKRYLILSKTSLSLAREAFHTYMDSLDHDSRIGYYVKKD